MEEKKKFKLGLLPKLIIAIIIGILFGQFLPEGFCRFVVTLSTLIAGSASFFVSDTLFPHFMSADALDRIAATAGNSLEP